MITHHLTYLEYDETMTADDIIRLHTAPQDATVVVWSMQQPGAIDNLMREGKLSGDAKFAFFDEKDDRKRFGYAWIQEQLSKRLSDYKQELPVWALLVRPPHSDRENDKLLRIEIPKSRMLISFYFPWTQLQWTFAYLWKVKIWPNRWPADVCPYAAIDAAERANVFIGPHRERRMEWNEVECRSSWERMFDLTLISREDSLWGTTLQAMVPYILKDDVKDIRPLPKRTDW